MQGPHAFLISRALRSSSRLRGKTSASIIPFLEPRLFYFREVASAGKSAAIASCAAGTPVSTLFLKHTPSGRTQDDARVVVGKKGRTLAHQNQNQSFFFLPTARESREDDAGPEPGQERAIEQLPSHYQNTRDLSKPARLNRAHQSTLPTYSI